MADTRVIPEGQRIQHRDPLRIYVVWHPACADGRALARSIYDWFHASSTELVRAGLGLPVFYRCANSNGTPGVPRHIALVEAEFNVIVPLVDENLVSDPAWVRYIVDLACEASTRCAVYPVALHPSAYRLPAPIRRVNYIRVDIPDDSTEQAEEARSARRALRLRRQLTQICARELEARLAGASEHGDAPPPPLTIFLSHAKADGVDIAESLKGDINQYGQLKAYYDQNDLPLGHAFASELERAATTGSVAMLAIFTDAYSTRPWCRREIRLARTPRPDLSSPRRWHTHPVLVVDGLEGSRTRCVPEFGNVPIVRWRKDAAAEVLDSLVLELLLSAYHRLRARAVSDDVGRHVISWVPDLPTLLELVCHRDAGDMRELVYPGHGIPPYDRDTFARYFATLRLKTFEEIA